MARKAGRPKNSSIAEAEGQTGSDSHDDHEEVISPHKPMSKAGAARAALAEGHSVPREAIVYIKDRYGLDMSPQQFSAEKCRLKARATDPDFGMFKSQPGVRPEAVAKNPRRAEFGESELLESLEVMKPLIDRLGADKVKRMVDLLG